MNAFVWPRDGAWPGLLMLLGIISLGIVGGCGKEELANLTQQVKEATVEKIDIPMPQIKPNPVGELQLATSTPLNLTNISIEVLVVGDGRPNVMQMQTSVPNAPTAPAFLFRAETNATTAAQLIGQTIPVTMFVQATETGPIWMSPDDRPVTITFDKLEETEVVGRINAGTLLGTDGQETPVSGAFRAVINPGASEIRTTMLLMNERSLRCS